MKFIEATLVMPLTILITLSLIVIMMNMYEGLVLQAQEHMDTVSDLYGQGDTFVLVLYGEVKELFAKLLR